MAGVEFLLHQALMPCGSMGWSVNQKRLGLNIFDLATLLPCAVEGSVSQAVKPKRGP